MPERPEHIAYINSVLSAGVDRATLMQIYKICAMRKRFCIIGYNDYAKHIINLLPGSIEHIIDDDESVVGITYRGHTVFRSDIDITSTVLVFCKYEYISEYTAKIK